LDRRRNNYWQLPSFKEEGMNNDNCLISKVKKKRENLDSSYSKAKLKVFFPPLEGEDEPNDSKIYIAGSS